MLGRIKSQTKGNFPVSKSLFKGILNYIRNVNIHLVDNLIRMMNIKSCFFKKYFHKDMATLLIQYIKILLINK